MSEAQAKTIEALVEIIADKDKMLDALAETIDINEETIARLDNAAAKSLVLEVELVKTQRALARAEELSDE